MASVQALIHHPSVAHYLRFVASTVGRDKILRTLQYFARFYAWYLLRTNHTANKIAPWETIKKQFGLTRKALRLGKNVEHFKAAQVACENKDQDRFLKYCTIGRQLGYGVYLSLDALTYLDSSGIKKLQQAKRLQAAAYRAWFIGIMFNIIGGLYTLKRLDSIEKADTSGEGRKRLQKDWKTAQIQMTSDVCDVLIPASALGYLKLDDGIVGLAGTISSLIGVWTTWQKTA